MDNTQGVGRCVFLDFGSVDLDQDLDRSALLKALPRLEFYAHTSTAELQDRLKDVEVVLTNSVPFSGDLLRQLPSLKFIGLTATGYNHIDIKAAKELGIAVTNLKDYCTQSVAQHAFAGLLCLNQRLLSLHTQVRQGHWDSKSPGRIRELPGQTLGIIGHGVLGQAMAKLARAFGMNVLVAQRPGKPNPDHVPFNELLSRSDVISLHVPLNDETKGLIGTKELQLMQSHAILINVARGAVVDTHALAHALRHQLIGGAFIDVFSPEPPQPDHPLLAADLNNIVLSPHLAWGSFEARQRAIDELAANVQAFFSNESRLRVV